MQVLLLPLLFMLIKLFNRTYVFILSQLGKIVQSPASEEEIDQSTGWDAQGHKILTSPRDADSTAPPHFSLSDIFPFIQNGAQAMVDDSLTRCFDDAPPRRWNYLTRNGVRLTENLDHTLIWLLGFFVRYIILFPMRLCFLLSAVNLFFWVFVLLPYLPSRRLRCVAEKVCVRIIANLFIMSWSGVINYHGKKPNENGIVVANHTSPIDVIVLMKQNFYSLVGQRHGGFVGAMQKAMNAGLGHIWFERGQVDDRRAVAKRLQDHVSDASKAPVVVFPEGTCVNNEYCVMFKKGIFELDTVVHPIAIKYNKQFADAYWNSRACGFLGHLFHLMSSWAVVCDVWYLPPQRRKPEESSVEFAHRVQSMIAKKAGLITVSWDGYLKREKLNIKYLEQQQKAFADYLSSREIFTESSPAHRFNSESSLEAPGGIQRTLSSTKDALLNPLRSFASHVFAPRTRSLSDSETIESKRSVYNDNKILSGLHHRPRPAPSVVA